MAQASHQTAPDLPRGGEKRAFPRHAVRLPATCLAGQGRQGCEVRDFCEHGLLIVFEPGQASPPMVGETVGITAVVPPGFELALSGRVVRSDGTSAGLALVDPDREAIARLAALAASQATASAPSSSAVSSARSAAGRSALLAACRERVQRRLGTIADDMLTSLTDELTQAAERPGTQAEHVRFLDMLAVLRRSGGSLRDSFLAAVPPHIETFLREEGDAAPTAAAVDPQHLTLVEEDALEDWLAVTDIAGHIESRFQRLLTELERRLAEVIGRAIVRQRNPFGAQVFVQAFQDALRTLSLPKATNQLCYTVFRGVLIRQLEPLYADLNGFLAGQGVLPDLRLTVIRSQDGRSDHRRPARAAAQNGDRNAAAPAAGEATASQPAIEQTLYDLVRELQLLRREIGQEPGGSPAPGLSASSAETPGEACDPEQIIRILDQLQSNPVERPAGDAVVRDYRSLVLSQLPAERGSRVGEREGAILDVAGNLFAVMLKDDMVAKSVRDWLGRLEIPLLKLALRDDSLFVDRNHVARQVVNRIGQLEVYDARETTSDNAIIREVNTLIERISAESSLNKDVLTAALKRLNGLIRVQNQAYEENVKDVIRECDDSSSSDTGGAETAGARVEEEQDEWRRRAKRLQSGTWVTFTIDPANPRRLRLAWVSKKRDRYAFVNIRGMKELVLDLDRFAEQLRVGTAVVQDGGGEPTLDRAQYMMLQELHHKLLHETTHDQLTGLVNRREFERQLGEALVAAQQLDRRHSLCYFDIAQFSVINTTCGHQAGDRLLVEVAGLLRTAMGEAALIARVGSDEFAVLLENCPANYGRKVCDDFLQSLQSYRFVWEDERYTLSFAIGVVQTDAFAEVSSLVQAAEACCHAAGARGINQIEVYHRDNAHVSSKHRAIQWLNRIDKALDEGRLELRCQRILPLGVQGAAHRHSEVLLALTDDEGMPISPQEFIITAEHYHRMPAIDRWVIRTVFGLMAEHRDRLDAIGGLAINLSGRSLSDESLKGFILAEMERTGVPMDRVCFEVTETAGISNLSDASEFILEMKKTGCLFSLDDFGSGLSSYAYLKNLPVDFLKIDGSFVRHMDVNATDSAVVKSITEIGHFMGKQIIAECVENQEVLDRLRDMGVDYAQGYAIELPQRLEDLLRGG